MELFVQVADAVGGQDGIGVRDLLDLGAADAYFRIGNKGAGLVIAAREPGKSRGKRGVAGVADHHRTGIRSAFSDNEIGAGFSDRGCDKQSDQQ